MTPTKIKAELRADDLKAALRGLPARIQQSVLKKGMRRGLTPIRERLRSEWRAAMYRGKPTHRRAIAAATLIDVRRSGRSSVPAVTGKVGVMYGAKGGASAKGRQRIWHLLEGGFRMVNRKSYANYPAGVRSERDGYRQFIKQNRKSIMSEGLPKPMRAEALRSMYAAARASFPAFISERTRRAKAREVGRVLIPGSFRSRGVVRAMMVNAMQKVREEVIQAAREALAGGRRGRNR